MNRIFKRTLDKYLEISTEEDLESILIWVDSFLAKADTDLRANFIEGLRPFFAKLENAYSEFERVIDDRDTSIQFNESELSRLYESLRAESDKQRHVLNRLQKILSLLNPPSAQIIHLPKDKQGYQEMLEIVSNVENLVMSHEENLDDLRSLYRESILIAGSQSYESFQANLSTATKRFLGQDVAVDIFSLERRPRAMALELWRNLDGDVLDSGQLTDSLTKVLEVHGASGNTVARLVFTLDSIHKVRLVEKRIEKFTALIPIIAATFEILGLVKGETLRARMEHELKTAEIVQKTLIPPKKVSLPNCGIHSCLESASECGGDWWNVYHFEDKDFVVLGDVTGHGTASALITAYSRGFFDARLHSKDVKLFKVIQDLDNELKALYGDGKLGMTLLGAELNHATGKGIIYSAGHPAPFLLSAQNLETTNVFSPDVGGPLLGGSGKHPMKLRTFEFELKAYKKIVLFSDGMNEAMDSEDRHFGLGRIRRILGKTKPSYSGALILRKLLFQYRKFMGDAINDDDLTLLVIDLEETQD